MLTNKYIQKTIILLILSSISLAASSEIYKWTDKNGKVYYSGKPIEEGAKKISIRKGPSEETVQEAKRRASSLINFQRKIRDIENENIKDKYKLDQKNKNKNKIISIICKQARNEIVMLGQRGASYTTNEKGEKHYLTDAEKNKMIAQMKFDIKKHC